MALFQFVIPANSVSTGYPATTQTIVADRGLARTVQHRVLTAKFGDGYEQRVLDGINTKGDSFNISFNNRDAADINLIAAFFDAQAAKNFDFTVTDHSGDTTMKVVCEGYNISYIQEFYHSLTCTFRRVYEP